MSAGDGGAAFPFLETGCDESTQHFGLSARDYFAAQALLLAYAAEEESPTGPNEEVSYKGIARRAYLMADAMIAERDSERGRGG